jgi:hypothetical protein
VTKRAKGEARYSEEIIYGTCSATQRFLKRKHIGVTEQFNVDEILIDIITFLVR